MKNSPIDSPRRYHLTDSVNDRITLLTVSVNIFFDHGYYIHAGCLPVIITIFNRVRTALDLAADADLSGRIEVWDIRQFLSTNVNEHSLFDAARNAKLANIIEKYNAIIDEKETDPSLRIEFEASSVRWRYDLQ